MEVFLEADIFDKRGNLLITPGLKVRHKDAGFEYTVDRVEGEGDNLKIFLKMPEEPRFEPPDPTTPITEMGPDVMTHGGFGGGSTSTPVSPNWAQSSVSKSDTGAVKSWKSMSESETEIPKTPSEMGIDTAPEDLGYERAPEKESFDDLEDETVFVIDQEEFEKDYEVE